MAAPSSKPQIKNEPKVRQLIEEMRCNGNLPALSENVRDICTIARQSKTCAVDLAAVIMRDAGLSSNLLATANSSFYSPKTSVKTVSSAVTFLGFEKVCSMALGLSLFKQTMKSAKNQKLAHLYASSYFSGTFAMSLAKERGYNNPEEIFVAGLLYRLPWLALANTFPKKFIEMETLINRGGQNYNQACLSIFEVEYNDICKGLIELYNLPSNVAESLELEGNEDNPIVGLVHEAGQLSNMLFGDKLGGKKNISEMNERVAKLLGREVFSTLDFIKQVCKRDYNISLFFKMDKEDIDMMVNVLEWGKGNPAMITSQTTFGEQGEGDQKDAAAEPENLVGHFLTELMIGCRGDVDVNKMLMLSQEALYRCLNHPEVFTVFFNREKNRLIGRFYVGNRRDVTADLFSINIHQTDSPVVKAINEKRSGRWLFGDDTLHLPEIKRTIFLKSAIFTPIQAHDNPIGLYFVGRTTDEPFSSREIAWMEQIVEYLGKSFESIKKAVPEYIPESKRQ